MQSRSRSSTPGRACARLIGRGWSQCRVRGVELLTVDSLSAIPGLVHGFSTRIGGQSKLQGTRALNLGFTDWDSKKAVSENRRELLCAIGAEEMRLVLLRQIHSDIARVIDEPALAPTGKPLAERGVTARSTAPAGDALLTSRPGLLLGTQTADCVPILLADTTTRAVAAIHAGWRGTLARIAAKAVGRMRLEFGTDPADIVAAIGPAIGRCCYEVGPEVAQAFLGQFRLAADWFDGPFERLALGEAPDFLPWLTMVPPGHEAPPERVWLDLRAANYWQLTDAGVRPGKIAVSTLCTACNTDLLFSYRREGAQTGRQMAVIGMKNTSE